VIFISSPIHVAFFHPCSIPVYHQISKTPGLEIFKIRSNIIVSRNIDGDFAKLVHISIYSIKQNYFYI